LERALDTEDVAAVGIEPDDRAAGLLLGRSLERRATVISSTWTRRDSVMRRLLAIADVLGLVGALGAASMIAAERSPKLGLLLSSLPTIPVWILLFKLYGLYDRDLKRINHAGLDDVPWLFHALVIGTLMMWGYTRVIPIHELTLLEGVLFVPLALVLISALRSAARRVMTRAMGPERMLVVGNGEPILTLVRKLKKHPQFEPIGLLTAERNGASGAAGVPVVGTPGELHSVARRLNPDRLVLSRRGLSNEEMRQFVETSRALSLKVSLMPAAVDALGTSVEIDEVDGITILGINPPVLGRSSRFVKRCFDVVVSSVLIVLLAPLMLVAAVAIKLDSPGPVLFRQRRVGKGGRPFKLLKLRTMVHGAEQQRAELMARSRDPRWLDLEHDPRVTWVGGLLRLSSLDEVPQLWNVVRGEMSLVGPRPLPVEEDRQVGGWMRGRLDLTPGITGMWQVLGRTSIPFDEMVKLDYLYVTNWSLWMDIRLLLRTAPVVIRRRGAN
jgi:exopolysaccharide biosynthesis polyprenyl glycosylphosphotransferase